MVISLLKKLEEFEIAGIIDNDKTGRLVTGINVIGTDEDLESFYEKGIHSALITVGSIKDNKKRFELFNMVRQLGYPWKRCGNASQDAAEGIYPTRGN